MWKHCHIRNLHVYGIFIIYAASTCKEISLVKVLSYIYSGLFQQWTTLYIRIFLRILDKSLFLISLPRWVRMVSPEIWRYNWQMMYCDVLLKKGVNGLNEKIKSINVLAVLHADSLSLKPTCSKYTAHITFGHESCQTTPSSVQFFLS